jgi:transcriptional regulator with XRE-family HTH domain
MIDGHRLRQLREEQGYSRREVAEKIGMTETQIVRYENGSSDATGDALTQLAKVFNVSVDFLLGLTDNPKPNVSTDLTVEEITAINAWRRGDYREVMRIVGGEGH